MNCSRRPNPYYGIVLLTITLFGCSRSEFEQQYQSAILENPAGVELEIRTREGRKQFAISEPVELEEFYTSKYSGLWHIEVLDGWNEASASDVIHITDGKTIWEEPRQPLVGVICCDSRHVWLSLEPTRIPYKLFDSPTRANREGLKNQEWLALRLPSNPGKYRVYLTSRRVFGRSNTMTTYLGKGPPVSSNILDLEVR